MDEVTAVEPDNRFGSLAISRDSLCYRSTREPN